MKMASARLLVVLVAFSCVVDALPPNFNSQCPFDVLSNGDISAILQNASLMKNEINCVLNKSACDQLGICIKLAIPEVIINNCVTCSPQQRSNAKKLISFMNHNYPGIMPQILRIYNKQHKPPRPG